MRYTIVGMPPNKEQALSTIQIYTALFNDERLHKEQTLSTNTRSIIQRRGSAKRTAAIRVDSKTFSGWHHPLSLEGWGVGGVIFYHMSPSLVVSDKTTCTAKSTSGCKTTNKKQYEHARPFIGCPQRFCARVRQSYRSTFLLRLTFVAFLR